MSLFSFNAIESEKKDPAKGKAGYRHRTVNRVLAHLKTLARWIHKLKPFPLGNPMAKIKLMPIGNGLEFEERLIHVEEKGGHTNTAYSIQYARITDQELAEALDDR